MSYFQNHKSDLAEMRIKPILELLNLSSTLENPWHKMMSNSTSCAGEENKNRSNILINVDKIEPFQTGSPPENQQDENSSERTSRNSDD